MKTMNTSYIRLPYCKPEVRTGTLLLERSICQSAIHDADNESIIYDNWLDSLE